MQWSWLAFPGLGAFTLAVAVGAFVYFARPDRAQNRWLGLFIVLEAIYLVSWTAGRFVFASEAGFRAMLVVGALAAALALASYFLFLATLDSPLSRPLRARFAGVAIAAYLVYAVGSWALLSPLFTDLSRQEGMWTEQGHALNQVNLDLLPLLAFLYGFAVAVSAWQRAEPGSSMRARAKAYAMAFGFRDAAFIVSIGGFSAIRAIWGYSDAFIDRVTAVAVPFIQLAYLLLLVYGIAKTHLFDIDLKIKWTLRRGTVAGIFLAVFLVVTVTAENFLTTRFGWAVGGAAAGILLFALAPLQRAADHLADRAMPGVAATSGYESFRKLSVYRSAVESAYEVGGINVKERQFLDRLRGKLGVAPDDARHVEAEFLAAGTR